MFVRIVWYNCWLAFAIIFAGWLVFRFDLAGFRPAFLAFSLGLAASLMVWLVALVAILVGKIRRRPVESRLTWVAVLAVLPVLAVFSMIGPGGFQAPLIHDVSTDTDNPPVFVLALNDRTVSENSLDYVGDAIARQQRQAYPDIQPLLLAASADEVKRAVQQYIDAQGWRLLGVSTSNGDLKIEAVASTVFMGFEDDVVFRLSETAQGTLLDMRSVSRLGKGDLGANAARIRHATENIRSQFQ